jgi:FkbM family methyltransferase
VNKDYLYDEDTLASVSGLLKDSLSKKIFSAIINTRKSNNYEDLPKKYPIEEQYFSKDIPLDTFTGFIDCGAYDGDTIDAMEKMGILCEKIYAFEPDLKNFKKLADKVKKYQKQAILFPCGVHSSTELLRFNSGSGEGSMISDEGNEVIQCISLDDALINVTRREGKMLLKMDIEGAELEALKGAKDLIQNNDVNLAICVYHKPKDIIEIPQLINTFGEYNFYLRLYGYYGMELVLYAIKNSEIL